jgi:CRP-like cAMP-binding protein
MNDRIAAMRMSEVFRRLPGATLDLLAAMMRQERFAAGDEVCAVGDAAECVYLVVDGTAEVFVPNRTEAVRTMSMGGLIGEYGMFGRRVRTATVKATSALVLGSLDYERFRRFLLDFPESALALLELTAERLIEKDQPRPFIPT